MRDPFEVLNISRDATLEDIDRAYRELAEQYHPSNYDDSTLRDMAAEKYKELEEAYRAVRTPHAHQQQKTYQDDDVRGQDIFSSYKDAFRRWQTNSTKKGFGNNATDWTQTANNTQQSTWQKSQSGWQNSQGQQSANHQSGNNQNPFGSPYYRSEIQGCRGGCADALCMMCLADCCCDCLC